MPTTNFGLRYPALTGVTPNVPRDLENLAQDTETFARLAAGAPLQDGVIDGGAFMVTERTAGGANMSVDVAASTGSGAVVSGYFVPAAASAQNVAIPSNASGNPRIDRIVVNAAGLVSYLAGTPTASASLNNRLGAPSVGSSLLLADVLVANGATSITNSAIRDRRRWARGAYARIVRSANGSGDGSPSAAYTYASGVMDLIDYLNLAPRIECSGAPIRVTLIGVLEATGGTLANGAYFVPQVDGAGVDGMPSVGANPGSTAGALVYYTAEGNRSLPLFQWTFKPSPGSHIIAPAWASASTSSAQIKLFANASRPCQWIVEELVRQDTPNNSVTTG